MVRFPMVLVVTIRMVISLLYNLSLTVKSLFFEDSWDPSYNAVLLAVPFSNYLLLFIDIEDSRLSSQSAHDQLFCWRPCTFYTRDLLHLSPCYIDVLRKTSVHCPVMEHTTLLRSSLFILRASARAALYAMPHVGSGPMSSGRFICLLPLG